MEGAMTDVKHCDGCHNDFYNGHNDIGVKQCWALKDATLEPRLLINVEQAPPYRQKPTLRPTCYKAQRYVTVKPEALDKDGYWKS
jgi:hypothetical protein